CRREPQLLRLRAVRQANELAAVQRRIRIERKPRIVVVLQRVDDRLADREVGQRTTREVHVDRVTARAARPPRHHGVVGIAREATNSAWARAGSTSDRRIAARIRSELMNFRHFSTSPPYRKSPSPQFTLAPGSICAAAAARFVKMPS